MPYASMPAIDQRACSNWTEQDKNLYNSLDYYLAKMQVDRRKFYVTWNRFFDKIPWTPNQGSTMRMVTKEPSPHVRQFANPNALNDAPKKDVIDVRERKQDEIVYRHRFESLPLHFVPSFKDFLTDHVDVCAEDIMEKQERFQDIFERGRIFQRSPFVAIADGQGAAAGLSVAAPVGNDFTDGKTTTWLQAMLALIGGEGYLSMELLNKLLTIMENDRRVLPFSGSGKGKENVGLDGKFALVLSSEAFNRFTFDKWLLANKNCSLDVVNDRFKGLLFGKITCIIEDLPIRMKNDATFEAPETREDSNTAYNKGETVPNPNYTDITKSPVEFAFMVGAKGYKTITVGPPPSAFASNGMPKGFGKMQWNGEIEATKNLMIPYYNDAGELQWEPNSYGEYLKFQSQVTYGIGAIQPRNIMPIMFKRKRGA